MVAYIGVAPIVSAFRGSASAPGILDQHGYSQGQRSDFPSVLDQIWQIYLLIFLLQSASAAFTPTFQATIPDVLPDEREYIRALSLSRLAYDTESLVSPMLAAALLTAINFQWLFSECPTGR